MEIKMLVVGKLEANCYILKKGNDCLVVDPGDEYERIKEHIGTCHPLGVLITHHHQDHIGALTELLNDYDVTVYEKGKIDEKEYHIGPFTFDCILTPGHSEDSISYYFKEENAMFTGDFVFRGTVGRCDLPTGDCEKMDESIAQIKMYPMDMIIYSGHGDATTLERECRTNPYF